MSYYDGTWSSGALPPELIDFEICHSMHIPWPALQQYPAYVRQCHWMFLNMRRENGWQ